MNNNKRFKVTYLKNEKVLYWTEQTVETVYVEAETAFDARIQVWKLPGCVVISKLQEVTEKKNNIFVRLINKLKTWGQK